MDSQYVGGGGDFWREIIHFKVIEVISNIVTVLEGIDGQVRLVRLQMDNFR